MQKRLTAEKAAYEEDREIAEKNLIRKTSRSRQGRKVGCFSAPAPG